MLWQRVVNWIKVNFHLAGTNQSSVLEKLRQWLAKIKPGLNPRAEWVKLKLVWLKDKIIGWITAFKNASWRTRWQMTRIPLATIFIIILIYNFGPLFLPPKISVSFPGKDSRETPLDARIEIIFDRDMNTGSVEKAFRTEPVLEGDMSWEGFQKFIFTPKVNLERDRIYQINFSGLVLSKYFIPMLGQTNLSFSTLGNPKVILSAPQIEAQEDYSAVTVVFDRPMIALTTATNSAIKPPAFSVNPPLQGEGRWLGTTAYQFRPDEPFSKATTYKITVPGGMRSQDNGVMKDEFSWEFSSERPRVESVTPKPNELFANPSASISAVFTQEINLQSLTDKFKVRDADGKPVSGKFEVNGRVAGFYPDTPLIREKYYQVTIDPGVKSLEGPNGMETQYFWSFTTTALPRVVSTKPIDGAKDIKEQHSLEVKFATPMDNESFKKKIIIDPAPENDPAVYFSSYNHINNLSISSYFGRSQTYTITIPASVIDQYGVPLGQPYTFSFTTAPYEPSITISPSGTYFGSFNQQITPRIVVQTTNVNKVDYSLYKLNREEFLDLYRRRNTSQCGTDESCRNWQSYDVTNLAKVKDWSENFAADFNTPVNVVTKVTDQAGNDLPAGIYFIDCKIPQGHDNMVMIVTKSTLTAKKSNNQIFVWATDQASGNTVANMTVQLIDMYNNTIVDGTTNNDGVFTKETNLFDKRDLFIFGQTADDFVVVSDTWDDGIRRWEFGLPSYYNWQERKVWNVKEDYKVFATVDRPIYRPGQKVYFKGVIRKDNDGAYENLQPGTQVHVSITDARGREIYSQNPGINSYGSVSGEYLLSGDANLGNYTLEISYTGNTFSQQFQVEEYRKPEVAVEVTTDKTAYTQAENAVTVIHSEYYFGAPVADAPVTWTLQTHDFSFRWDKDWRYEFGENDDYWSRPWWNYGYGSYYDSEKVTEGKGKTDSKGNLELILPLDINKFKTSQQMTIEATVNDINNQSVAASNIFTVHKAHIYAGIRPKNYSSSSGQTLTAELVTVDVAGKEVAGTSVSVDLYKRTWTQVKEKNPDDGQYYYVSKPNDAFIANNSTVTDSLGRGEVEFNPSEGGVYRAVAKVVDEFGNINKSSSYFWVSGYGFMTERTNNDRIVAVTDKSEYLVGEKLSVFVASPFASDSAKTLLTAERGSVLDYKIVDTSETSNNFEMEINPKFVPNAFIGAVLVRPGNSVKKPAEFKIGYTEVKVTDKSQNVDVIISTDKKRYRPQETMTVNIETKDKLGQSKPVELALGLVDKAVWDLGTVKLPDIYNVFYQPRNLEVDTSQLLTLSIDRINANTNLGSKGGSGGGGGGDYETMRREFPDTAYWQPHLTTDQNGKLQVQIKLPDSLTTWKLIGIANSDKAAFGSATSEIIVNRDIMVRPFLPRFLAVGDQSQLGAIVVNTSGIEQDLQVKIIGQGIKILEPDTKPGILKDGAQTKLTWSTLTESTTSATVKLVVFDKSGNDKDSVEVKLPVKSFAIPEVVATSGMAKDNAQEKILLPTEVDPTQGLANISISPALGAASIKGINYLWSYPYYCVEQTTSKLLPSIFINRIYHQANIEESAGITGKMLENMINDGIQRLNNEQKPDGGWGWWSEYESDPTMSAYAFIGLKEAKKDNYAVDVGVLTRAQNFLENSLLQKKSLSISRTAFVMYALIGYSKNLSPYASILYNRRFELGLEERAYLALVLKDAGMGGQANRVYQELLGLVKKTATTSHWEEPKNNYYYFSNNTTLNAVMLEVLTGFEKNNPLISEIVRYLMMIRRDEHWSSTLDTAAVIKAITNQLIEIGDSKLNLNYKVEMEGKKLGEGQWTKQDLLKMREFVVNVSSLNIGTENNLRFTKSGEGNLYYNLNLKYYLPFNEIAPLDQGMVVVREFVDKKGKVLPSGKIPENTETWVRLTIVAPEERHYVIVEDMLPAGLEGVNESLKNTSVLNSQRPDIKSKARNELWYFDHKEFHDDRVTLFAEYLPAGVYEIMYRVRATTPGKYHQLPASAYQMYVPDVSGHSDGGWFEVMAE